MILAFLKSHWLLFVALLLISIGTLVLLRVGYGIADRSWQEKWDQRDKADAEARLSFTQEQRRIELARQADIDQIQREADEENRKANAARAAAQRVADHCSQGSKPRSPSYSSETAAIPELPAAARLGETLAICSPSCTERLTQRREIMQQKLTGAAGLP